MLELEPHQLLFPPYSPLIASKREGGRVGSLTPRKKRKNTAVVAEEAPKPLFVYSAPKSVFFPYFSH